MAGNGWSISEGPYALVQARYSNIEGGWFGTGNIDAEPAFMDPGAFDYHLRLASPCVDAGTDAGAPDHDLDGDSRPLHGDGDGIALVDMGVDEFRLRRAWLPVILHR